MVRKERLDIWLVKRELFPSLERAKAVIMAGKVLVDDEIVDKPGTLIGPNSIVTVIVEGIPYVSRGGLKLKKALDEFGLEVQDKVALDVGVSTGGFTDCLLQQGAKLVIAIDVGYGQIAWKLRNHPRVRLLERTNIRYLTPEQIPELADIATIDLSFISVRKVLKNIIQLLKLDGELVILIKPQFEVGKGKVGKGGIVKDHQLHRKLLLELWQYFEGEGLMVKGLTFSPIKGAEGNIEFFFYLSKTDAEGKESARIKEVVEEAHKSLIETVEK